MPLASQGSGMLIVYSWEAHLQIPSPFPWRGQVTMYDLCLVVFGVGAARH
jgi:hypothetical protein